MGYKNKCHHHFHDYCGGYNDNENDVINEIENTLVQIQKQLQEQYQLQYQLQKQFQQQLQNQDQNQLDFDHSNFENIGNPIVNVTTETNITTMIAVAVAAGFIAKADAGNFDFDKVKEIIKMAKED